MHTTWQMVAPVMCIGLWLLHRLTNSPLLINLPWSYILSTLPVLRFSIQMLTFQLLNVWCKTISWIHSLLKLPFLVIASHSDFLHFTVGLYFITGFFIIISYYFIILYLISTILHSTSSHICGVRRSSPWHHLPLPSPILAY